MEFPYINIKYCTYNQSKNFVKCKLEDDEYY